MRLRTTKVFVDSRYAVLGTSGSSILFEIPGGVERYRSFGDPVSFFDGSARSTMPGKEALSASGPHAYQGLAAQHMSEGTAAQANPDGSVSISE